MRKGETKVTNILMINYYFFVSSVKHIRLLAFDSPE